jgi:hypothetical protein
MAIETAPTTSVPSAQPIPISMLLSVEDWRKYLELQELVLRTQLNWVREQLGKNPKRCPKCGEVMR